MTQHTKHTQHKGEMTMPKTYIVTLGPEDVVLIKSATGTLKRRVTPDPKKQVDVTGYSSAAVKPYPTEQVTCSGDGPPPIEPPPFPPPSGDNRIPNGRLEDAGGNASLLGWLQEPTKVWMNTHAPRPGCEGHFIQADRDFPPPAGGNVWKGGNPSSATIETFTAEDLPAHSEVWLSWICAHHMVAGSAVWELSGRVDSDAPWSAPDVFDITAGVPGTKICAAVGPVKILVPAGGFRQYRLRAAVTLASNADGVIFGDVKLTVK